MSATKLTNIGEIVTYNSHIKTIDHIKDRDILINNGIIENINRNINSDHKIFDC